MGAKEETKSSYLSGNWCYMFAFVFDASTKIDQA